MDAVSVNESIGVLAQDFAQTRLVVRDAAAAARGAAEQARDAARGAAEHAGSVREALLSDRTTMVLTLVALLVMGGLGLGPGWGLRGWWAPPPAGVFARYLAAPATIRIGCCARGAASNSRPTATHRPAS